MNSNPIRILLLLIGIFFCASAIIFIKASAIHPVLLAALRLLAAMLFLLPLFLRDLKKEPMPVSRCLKNSLIPGLFLGIHFITWLIAARMTNAANASLIVNLAPVVMPFILIALVHERVNRLEIIGTAAALGGTMVLFGSDFKISPDYFLGDILCFISMIFFTIYLALGRRRRPYKSIWLYVVPIYAAAGVGTLLISLCFVNPLTEPWSMHEALLLLGLAALPTVFGHSILNWAMTHMRGQLVSIMNMGQFIFAGIMAYFIFREIPAKEFLPASALVIGGALLALKGAQQTEHQS
ncbi:DMT family transporter [Pontiella sp.]|uniref:DMT family transporter n=1 Tax=Pontiella sp. TaxID=2837462 RepID=UPI00356AEFB2